MPNQELQSKAIEVDALEWKVASSDRYPNGYIEGYVSVKGSIDSYGDTVLDGAYIELEEFKRDGFVTVGHELSDLPVGYIESAREDGKGLFVLAPFHSSDDAQKVRKVCEERKAAGKSIGLSIDYYAMEWEYDKKSEYETRIRILKKIKVIGFAIVNVPAERLAEATAVKSGSGRPNEEQYKSLLAELEDWTSREEWIAENRKQGLTTVHLDRLTSIKQRIDSLLEIKAEPDAEDVPLGAIFELEQFAASLTQGAN